MSAITDYITAVDTAYNTIDESVSALETSLEGVTDDVKFLKETIVALENNPGPISAEDQALLTAALARVTALASRLSTVRDTLTTLDNATSRPTPPVEPPTP